MPSKGHEALVEKVARVICFETGSMGDPMPIEMQRVDRDWQEHTQTAKAAIFAIREALQEPNEAMIDAAVSAWNRRMEARALGGTLLFGGNPQATMSANWGAMLAASALVEQSK